MNYEGKIFDYRTLRLMVGIFAFSIPNVVTLISKQTLPGWSLPSISASYHTDAQDWFVGMLFVVGAFLLAYNGHGKWQPVWSRVAAIAAFCVALFPTACNWPDICEACVPAYKSTIHVSSAGVFFSILTYFCLGPFRTKIKGKHGKKRLRSGIYIACGVIMIICMAAILVANLALPEELVDELGIVYWGEFVALWAFGVAWFTAGKATRLLAEEDEQLHLFK